MNEKFLNADRFGCIIHEVRLKSQVEQLIRQLLISDEQILKVPVLFSGSHQHEENM